MKAPHKRAMKTGSGEAATAARVRKGSKDVTNYTAPKTKSKDAGTRNMSGTRGGKSKAGGKSSQLNSQGDKRGGQTSGRSRTNKGRNRIGSGRSQAFT